MLARLRAGKGFDGDVFAVMRALEFDLRSEVVCVLSRRCEVGSESGDAEDATAVGDNLIVLRGGAGMKDFGVGWY